LTHAFLKLTRVLLRLTHARAALSSALLDFFVTALFLASWRLGDLSRRRRLGESAV
jgi:hypothetical protein